MDMFCIHQWTIGLDIAMNLQSRLKILNKKGAY